MESGLSNSIGFMLSFQILITKSKSYPYYSCNLKLHSQKSFEKKKRGHSGDKCEKQGLQTGFVFTSSNTALDEAWKFGPYMPPQSQFLLHQRLVPAGVIVWISFHPRILQSLLM